MKHLQTVEQLSSAEINEILTLAKDLKTNRGKEVKDLPLKGQTWALVFNKASTRTRVSFEVGIRELGGSSLYLSANDIQMGRGETVADTARTLSRYVHGVVIRTFAQSDIETFARVGSVPVINALTDDEHPCQILADLQTVAEKLGLLKGKKIVFLGDGACNVCTSWLFGASKTGMELWVAAPKQFQPAADPVKRAGGAIHITDDVAQAARNADVLYTDVWVSMGKEAEAAERLKVLAPYQLNANVLKLALPNALVMHCLPAYVGREITADVFEAHQQTIFDQAENRLHAQKAILTMLAREWRK
ncbi:MAG TPA: ornithine carbamoyltransferase [Verrucomicrobiae bacterium]|nr:ornithine carbamoyltransferase [Verrucomicrobiae bacterium]